MIYVADEPKMISPPRDEGAAGELERLGDEIAELAAHLHAAIYRLLERLRVFDERGGWGGGFRSCAHWLSWRTGIGLGAAREHVRVARALNELPQLSEAMRRGRLSFSKIRALTRIATPTNEKQLLELARQGTAPHIETVVRAWRRVDRLEEQRLECERHRLRDLTLYHDDDGMYVVRGRLDPEVGAVLDRALALAGEALYGRRAAANARATSDAGLEDETAAATAGQRRADAIGLIAEFALRHGLDADARGGDDEMATTTVADEADGAEEILANASCARICTSLSTCVYEAVRVAARQDEATGRDMIAAAEATSRATQASPPPPGTQPALRIARNAGPRNAARSTTTRGAGSTRASPVGRADRLQVVVHVDAQALRADSDHGQSVLAPGVCVPAETSRRLACDAGRVVMTHDAEGNVLGVGRRTRTVPSAIRRALDQRDGGCRFPGCGLRYCDAHHITHWADGGETKLDNLVNLCRRHHRAVHEEGFRVRLTASGEITFVRPDGRPLPGVPESPDLPADPVAGLAAAHRASGVEIDRTTAMSWWMGERLDLDVALMTLRGP